MLPKMEPNRKLEKIFVSLLPLLICLELVTKSNASFSFQLQPNCATGCGALEHDITTLYKIPERDTTGPFPLGVAVIDKACLVFAYIFRFVASKHRLQMIAHFSDCIKHAKSARQEAVQINLLTALLGSLKVKTVNVLLRF